MKKIGLLLLFAISCLFSNAQKYEIKLKINGVSDTVIYLGHYFGEKKLVLDTTTIDNNGFAVFSGDKELNKGIYLIVMPSRGMTYFEFLVGDDKYFHLETDTSDFLANMRIKGCKENPVFNKYQRKMLDFQTEYQALSEDYKQAKDNEGEQKRISDIITEQNNKRTEYLDKLIKKNKGTFFSKILLAMKEVKIPEPPKDNEGNVIETDFQYKYYKAHYWDYIDFSERGLLRTPIFETKLYFYFDKMVVPVADSMIPEARTIIQKAYDAGDSLMFQYIVSELLHYFESSKIMGLDAVFVDIAEHWYLSGKAVWADSTFLSKLNERVEKITPTQLGKIAVDLKRMQTVDEKYISLHQVEAAYTVLVFYEPDCGHCKKEIPILMQNFRDSLQAMDVKVFALYTQYDRSEWEEFIKEKDLNADGWYNVWDGPYPHSNFRNSYDMYSTPLIYVLNRDKEIVGKRIGADKIKSWIDILESQKDKFRF